MTPNPDIRWKQRLQSFDRALGLLHEALEKGPDALNELEKEGTIQRFEYCLELGWKTAKDYLEDAGVVINPVTPREVIKQAFAAKLIRDGQIWIDMLNHRNLLSHTYDPAVFGDAVEKLATSYRPAMDELHEFLTRKSQE